MLTRYRTQSLILIFEVVLSLKKALFSAKFAKCALSVYMSRIRFCLPSWQPLVTEGKYPRRKIGVLSLRNGFAGNYLQPALLCGLWSGCGLLKIKIFSFQSVCFILQDMSAVYGLVILLFI